MDFVNTEGLKKDSDFRHVYKNGKSFSNKYLVAYIYKNNLNLNRVGFSVSKKVGKAVLRNKIRRLLKENFRLIDNNLNQGHDIIFIARIACKECDFSIIKKSMINLVKKCSILN